MNVCAYGLVTMSGFMDILYHCRLFSYQSLLTASVKTVIMHTPLNNQPLMEKPARLFQVPEIFHTSELPRE